MRAATSSFVTKTRSAERVVSMALAHADKYPHSSGILFLTGTLAKRGKSVAQALADAPGETSWLIAAVPGVLTEDGELEQEDAAVGMFLPKEKTPLVVTRSSDRAFGLELSDSLKKSPGASVMVLIRGDDPDDSWLAALDEGLGSHEDRFFGGGTMPGQDIWAVEGEAVTSGVAAAMVIPRRWLGRVAASSACRLLSPLTTVTKTSGSMLLELDGLEALEVLSHSAHGLEDQPLVLLAIAPEEGALSPEGRTLALRAIHGVDPNRGGVLVGDDFPEGTKVAFAVRDSHGARTDLEAHLRSLRRGCAGTAPSFGFYVSCAGRGRSLYGAPNVDVRLIRQHFPGMPLVGFHSTFELAPMAGRLTPQIYSGVLSVFCAPS